MLDFLELDALASRYHLLKRFAHGEVRNQDVLLVGDVAPNALPSSLRVVSVDTLDGNILVVTTRRNAENLTKGRVRLTKKPVIADWDGLDDRFLRYFDKAT